MAKQAKSASEKAVEAKDDMGVDGGDKPISASGAKSPLSKSQVSGSQTGGRESSRGASATKTRQSERRAGNFGIFLSGVAVVLSVLALVAIVSYELWIEHLRPYLPPSPAAISAAKEKQQIRAGLANLQMELERQNVQLKALQDVVNALQTISQTRSGEAFPPTIFSDNLEYVQQQLTSVMVEMTANRVALRRLQQLAELSPAEPLGVAEESPLLNSDAMLVSVTALLRQSYLQNIPLGDRLTVLEKLATHALPEDSRLQKIYAALNEFRDSPIPTNYILISTYKDLRPQVNLAFLGQSGHSDSDDVLARIWLRIKRLVQLRRTTDEAWGQSPQALLQTAVMAADFATALALISSFDEVSAEVADWRQALQSRQRADVAFGELEAYILSKLAKLSADLDAQ